MSTILYALGFVIFCPLFIYALSSAITATGKFLAAFVFEPFLVLGERARKYLCKFR